MNCTGTPQDEDLDELDKRQGIIALTLFATVTAALLAKAGQRCPANEEYVKNPRCPDVACSMLKKGHARSGDGVSPCMVGNLTIEPGCFCVPNYARNKAGICIPVEQCKHLDMSAEQRCPANEVYADEPTCPDITCDMICEVPPRSGDPPCAHGNHTFRSQCYCVPDFARNKAGICIPVEQCKCTQGM
ncbi:putative mucin-19-like [Ditylenchus destructor]|uniref:Mucin-19-like n=1 Tax=Ditylenchus destructor TaxID=166010 RepID=A0AAD4R046_9BILA|nr:putative mucin-19-like [Ditylenchus destructor]